MKEFSSYIVSLFVVITSTLSSASLLGSASVLEAFRTIPEIHSLALLLKVFPAKEYDP